MYSVLNEVNLKIVEGIPVDLFTESIGEDTKRKFLTFVAENYQKALNGCPGNMGFSWRANNMKGKELAERENVSLFFSQWQYPGKEWMITFNISCHDGKIATETWLDIYAPDFPDAVVEWLEHEHQREAEEYVRDKERRMEGMKTVHTVGELMSVLSGMDPNTKIIIRTAWCDGNLDEDGFIYDYKVSDDGNLVFINYPDF